MEPLSLLAELYGEGRATTQRMREHGLSTLEDICAQGPQVLARALNISVRAANRMLGEARSMRQENLFEIEKKNAPALDNFPQDRQPPSGFKVEVLDMVAKRFC